MDYQMLFNLAVTIAGSLGGWVLGRITKSLDRLDEDVRNMPEKYVFKEDYKSTIKELKILLDQHFERIMDRLDGKQDKPGR